MFEKKCTLLHSQKKRVYDILREAGLEPAEFTWSDMQVVEKLIVSRLDHRGGQQHYFQFSSYEMNAWCIACPGVYRTMDYGYPKTWEEQEGIVRKWAESLRREMDTQDPWAELAKYRVVFDGELSTEIVNEPIPAVEAEQIGQALQRLVDYASRELALNHDQATLVRDKLGYLAEAARRERSRDWNYTAMGDWGSMAAALSLTEGQAAILWQTIRREIGPFPALLPADGRTPEAAQRKKGLFGIRLIGGRSSEAKRSAGETAR